MARTTRLLKSLSGLIFPLVLLIILAVGGGATWLVYKAAHPPATKYLMTPEKYGRLSSRAAQVTSESWPNKDGSTSYGWLLRGAENAPAVILFHRYGADRSHVLDMGVKLNESTNFTVLMPDLRAHGEQAGTRVCTFGGCGTEDAASAVAFLRGLRTPTEIALVGKRLGVYGVELGAMHALAAAEADTNVAAIALDSVPENSDALLSQVVAHRFPFMSVVTTRLARLGTYVYFFDGCYRRSSTCETAQKLTNRNALLLGGVDSPDNQAATGKLSKCFGSGTNSESKLDLSPSGYSIVNASIEQSEAYDQRIIDFFRNSLME